MPDCSESRDQFIAGQDEGRLTCEKHETTGTGKVYLQTYGSGIFQDKSNGVKSNGLT